ncbi:ABC-2 type transport system ATP-binding protein [Anaerocolumna jejuensis DSM 15929]|uniref:ABC-2 type transport system ATP-binding protein n=1 Tax=Anaerocolumna jejuensis DSM 15929 TaxID=1121322 RepID=A0A1M6MRK0_9FIRM|nr:ABC transporter ATP-binding protein [Anaerocolumna jejuensis]SHJ86074.1 ABC-2 type transport system ATP-binding protein [Anaerocolumna jejuensis DSM 15929]
MLQIINLSKSYEGKKAVDNLSLEVEAGDIYGFIGHNGAGKTTTLKAVSGILDFEEGDIIIDGISVKKDALSCKKKMAYIPDNPDIYEHLTGMEFLKFIGDIYEVQKSERVLRIERYGKEFELLSALSDPIASYSHGMKQKLVLMSAFLHKPRLLLLDEPFVGLDPSASHTLKNLMKELCSEGSAIFFSTHVLEVAEKLCNKIAVIKGGKLIESGETNKVKGNQSLEDVFLELTRE